MSEVDDVNHLAMWSCGKCVQALLFGKKGFLVLKHTEFIVSTALSVRLGYSVYLVVNISNLQPGGCWFNVQLMQISFLECFVSYLWVVSWTWSPVMEFYNYSSI